MNIQINHQIGGSTHSLVYYKLNNKIYWFENAWYDERGIHEYDSISKMKEDIKKKYPLDKGFNKILMKTIPNYLIKPGDSLEEWCRKVAEYGGK